MSVDEPIKTSPVRGVLLIGSPTLNDVQHVRLTQCKASSPGGGGRGQLCADGVIECGGRTNNQPWEELCFL